MTDIHTKSLVAQLVYILLVFPNGIFTVQITPSPIIELSTKYKHTPIRHFEIFKYIYIYILISKA